MGGDILHFQVDLMSVPRPTITEAARVRDRIEALIRERRYAHLHPEIGALVVTPFPRFAVEYRITDEERGARDRCDAMVLGERLRVLVRDSQRRWAEDTYPVDIGYASWGVSGARFP